MAESSALKLPAATRLVALVLALGLTRCVAEEEILGGVAVAGSGSVGTAGAGAAAEGGATDGGAPDSGATDGGATGAQPPTQAWSSETCYEALARGVDGDTCAGPFGCNTAVRDCCQWSATCLGGFLSLAETCDACGCQADDDCPFGLVCTTGQCVECPSQGACAFPLAPALRNGCVSCVTAGDCSSDADCDVDSICYAGRNCLPGCLGDPSCCSGNICAAPGCGSAAELDCSIVGCEPGAVCNVVDPGHFCACESGQWLCAIAAPNVCVWP